MKIGEIKSEEVRNEAVRLFVLQSPKQRNEEMALNFPLFYAFPFGTTLQGRRFWFELQKGKTPNTPDLKLPEKNPSE